MRATKLLHSIKRLPYKARLRVLKLPSMKYRRIRGDMIEIYKIINHKYDINTTLALRLNSDYITRGNKHKLQQYHCKYDLRKYFLQIESSVYGIVYLAMLLMYLVLMLSKIV